MELIVLGTGASEAVPCESCKCDFCETARKRGGKDFRTRSSLRVDESLHIDFSPDSMIQARDLKLTFEKLSDILLTHSHDDHIDISQLMCRNCATHPTPINCNIYMPRAAIPVIERTVNAYKTIRAESSPYFKRYTLIPIDEFTDFIINGYTVTTIRSSHTGYGENEKGFNYLIEKDGKSFLYACDTGYYDEDTWEFLKGKHVDCLIIECTYGACTFLQKFAPEHLNISNMILMIEHMSNIGFINNDTQIITTHMSHLSLLNHDEMQAQLTPIKVGYDGMKIRL